MGNNMGILNAQATDTDELAQIVSAGLTDLNVLWIALR
jgi:hypothetical protein